MDDLYVNTNGEILSLSPLDIQNGMDISLTKLTSEESKAHSNPPKSNDQIQSDAQVLRDTATEDAIELDDTGAIYQIDSAAREAISDARTKAELENIDTATTRQWRLANNKWRETSLDELNSLLLAYIDRKDMIWQAFNEWDTGDKSEAFKL